MPTSLHLYLPAVSAAERVAQSLQQSLGTAVRVRAWPQAAAGIVGLREQSQRQPHLAGDGCLAILLPTLALLD